MLAALVLCGIGCTVAAASTTTVRVTARVLPRLDVHLDRPSALQVSLLDVQRGYLDARAPMSVTGNVPGRVPLAVTIGSGPVRHVQVFGPQGMMEVPADGALFDVGAFVRGEQTALVFRFLLAPGTRPGSYAWPVSIFPAP